MGYLRWGSREQVSVYGGAPAAGARLGLGWHVGNVSWRIQTVRAAFQTPRVVLKLSLGRFTPVTFTLCAHALTGGER